MAKPTPAKPNMHTQRHAQQVLRRLKKAYPDATIALDFTNPLELLVATILSAQCTDVRVNQVTPALFGKYRTAADYAGADPARFEDEIRSTGFFRNKTKSILGACRRIEEEFDGKVPDTMEDLLTLPGVARKTANVVLGNAFGIASGVVVDTHVQRLARRIGLTRETQPEKIEQDLMALFPKKEWIDLGHRLIAHGRTVCAAKSPRCDGCPLEDLCPRIGVEAQKGKKARKTG